MEKAEKVRKTVTRISAGVIFACVLMLILQLSLFTPEAYAEVSCNSTISCGGGKTASCYASGDGSSCSGGTCTDGEGHTSTASCDKK